MKSLIEKGTHFLANGDPFVSTKTLATSGITKIQLVATAIFALVLVMTGLVYSFGGRELKGAIKKKWVDVGVAVVIVYGATMIITFIVQFVQTNGFGGGGAPTI